MYYVYMTRYMTIVVYYAVLRMIQQVPIQQVPIPLHDTLQQVPSSSSVMIHQ